MRDKIPIIAFAAFLFMGCNQKIYTGLLDEIKHGKTATLVASQDTTALDSAQKTKLIHYYYKTLYGLDDNSVYSNEQNPARLFIQRPTLIRQEGFGAPIILYPNDSLQIAYDLYGDMTFSGAIAQRATDLTAFAFWCEKLDSLTLRLDTFFIRQTQSAQDAFHKTLALQNEVKKISDESVSVMGELTNKFAISNDVKEQFWNYQQSFLSGKKLEYYWVTKKYGGVDSVFTARYPELVDYFNKINSHKKLAFHYAQLWELMEQMVTYKKGVPSVYDDSSLNTYLLEAKKMFRGVSYDYLTANIIYRAYKNKIIKVGELERYGRKKLKDKYYKAAIKAIGKSYRNAEYYVSSDQDKSVLSASEKSAIVEDELFSKFKGKLVLVDFWASWCIPCRKEMPAMRELKRQYLGKDIVFVTISIDNSLLSWQKAIEAEKFNSEHNYLLNKTDSIFIFKDRVISEIPRYFLLNKDGAVISDNAPAPSSIQLKSLIDKYLF